MTGSLTEESFASGLLEYPHYTRPRDLEGRTIPDVLLSGDHEEIAKWRREQAEELHKDPPARSLGKAREGVNLIQALASIQTQTLTQVRAVWRERYNLP